MPWIDPTDASGPGAYFIDDRTGAKKRLVDAKQEWTGKLVHSDEWEPRHAQDIVRGRRQKTPAPNPSPEPSDSFLAVNDVTASDL